MSISMYQGSAYNLPLADKSVDLIITNPPLPSTDGVYFGGDQTQQLSQGSSTVRTEYWNNLVQSTKEMMRVLKDDGNLLIGLGQTDYPKIDVLEYEHVMLCVKELGLTLTSEISWEMNQPVYSSENLHTENVVFRHYTKNSDYTRNPFEVINLNPASWKISNFIDKNPELTALGGLDHAFPIELASRLIRCFSHFDSVIFDPFAGTGTVCLAAGLHGRSSIYLDCSTNQFNVAKKRFELFNLETVVI